MFVDFNLKGNKQKFKQNENHKEKGRKLGKNKQISIVGVLCAGREVFCFVVFCMCLLSTITGDLFAEER